MQNVREAAWVICVGLACAFATADRPAGAGLMNSKVAWAAFIAGGVVADLWRARASDGSTLSQATRDTFRTDTRPGRLAFIAAWGSLAAWFSAHILEHPADSHRSK